MSKAAALFGTDGIRGRVGIWPLTASGCLTIGRSIAAAFGASGSVVIGRDSRESGPALASALGAGLAEGGCDVCLVGLAPTPAIAHLSRQGHRGGVVLTASHNPHHDNGIKVFGPAGFKVSDGEQALIEAGISGHREGEDAEATAGIGGYGDVRRDPSALGSYREDCLSVLGAPDALRGLKVVIDCANGAGSEVAGAVFEAAGAECRLINHIPDGRNINRGCGALHPEALGEEVKAWGADLGVALDGDADRCILVDEAGSTLNGDAIIALLACHEREQGGLGDPRVVMTSMSNLGVELYLKERGITLLRTKVGDRYVLERLRKEGLNLGGEQSGHIIDLRHSTTGDGLLTGLRVAEIMAEGAAPLSTLAGQIPTFPQLLVNVPVTARPPLNTLPKVQGAIAEVTGLLGDRGRVVVRYSGTELLARVMVEGERIEDVERFAHRIADAF